MVYKQRITQRTNTTKTWQTDNQHCPVLHYHTMTLLSLFLYLKILELLRSKAPFMQIQCKHYAWNFITIFIKYVHTSKFMCNSTLRNNYDISLYIRFETNSIPMRRQRKAKQNCWRAGRSQQAGNIIWTAVGQTLHFWNYVT